MNRRPVIRAVAALGQHLALVAFAVVATAQAFAPMLA